MATFLSIIGFALLVVETIVGIVANAFIVLVGFTEWFGSRKISRTDLVLSSLGMSRLLLQAIVMLHITMTSFFLHTYVLTHAHLIVTILWFFTDTINIWFATCLSVWYFTKIAVFSHPIFLRVKQRSSGLLPWVLLGSVAFSALMTIIMYTRKFAGLAICDPYILLLNDSSSSETKSSCSSKELAFSVVVPSAIPSVIFLSSTVLLIISLWKHARHLQQNGIGLRDLNTNAHLSAIKSLVSFAILYFSNFVAVTSRSILVWTSNNHIWSSIVFQNISALYPSGHAVILILINPKLKQAWVRMIHHFRCHVSKPQS